MSDVREDLKVGDGVYVFDTRGYGHKGTVAKLGRKWLTVAIKHGDTFQFDRTAAFAGRHEYGRAPVLMTAEQFALGEQLQVLSDNAGRHCKKLTNIHLAVNRGDLAQARMDLRRALAEYAMEIDQFATEVPNATPSK